jgi:hypothetical protein
MNFTRQRAFRFNFLLLIAGIVLCGGGMLFNAILTESRVSALVNSVTSGGFFICVIALAWAGASAIGSWFRFNAEPMTLKMFRACIWLLATYGFGVVILTFAGYDTLSPPLSNLFLIVGSVGVAASVGMFFLCGVRPPEQRVSVQ